MSIWRLMRATADIGRTAAARRRLAAIATTLAAVLLFGVTASAALPVAVFGSGLGTHRALVVALLLNVALIIFGWRRCRDLEGEIKEREAAEQRASLLESRDHLTGFLNRRALVEQANAEFAANPGIPVAILLIDLDHFKHVNDLHGHAAGDDLLRLASRKISASTPSSALCARLGGDEFAVLLFGADADSDITTALGDVILAALWRTLDAYVQSHAGASIGIAWYERDGDIESLLRRADIALYAAKRQGRNRIVCFDDNMEQELRRRNAIEAGIRSGLGAGEFLPYYEPQVDLATGALMGFEALARWRHPTEGLLLPSEFIPVAEASGLIADLSASLIRQALSDARDWGRLTISVNISPVQLADPLLAHRIVKLLTDTRFPAPRLTIEITESSLFENLELARQTVESLKNQGIRIALDDFGTGYSSLGHLQALPFDSLKIDRSFVGAVGAGGEKAAIVSAIARLGTSLGLPVIAEGIEDEATRRQLLQLGCSVGQGWLFGKPVAAHEVPAILAAAKIYEDVETARRRTWQIRRSRC